MLERKRQSGETIMTPTGNKSEFSARSFAMLMSRFGHEGFPDMEKTTWRDILEDSFALTPEQRRRMESLSEQLSTEMQKRFAEADRRSREGARVRGRIVTREDGSHLAYWSIEPREASSGASAVAEREAAMLPIVCCDANCGDWDFLCNDAPIGTSQ